MPIAAPANSTPACAGGATPVRVHRAPRAPASAARAARGNPFAAPARVSRLQIEITTGCNLRCVGCQRTIGLEAKTWRSTHMPLERYEAVLRHAPEARALVLQGIGEPTLHPDIEQFVAIARASGRYPLVSFNTNGLVRDLAFYRSLKATGLGHVSISVDSLQPHTAEALRSGTDVAQLRASIAGLASLFPNVTASIVLSRGNLDELPELLESIAALGVRVIEIQPLISYAATSVPLVLDERDGARARETIARMRAKLPGVTVLAAPSLTPTGARCRRPFEALYVTVEGFLTPCCTTDDVSQFGPVNLARTPFEQAWQDPGVAAWFERFLDGEPEICVGCTFNPSGAGRREPTLADGIALQLRGEHAQAQRVLEQVVATNGTAEALNRLGIAALARQDAQAALPLLQAAHALSPEPRIAHNCAVALVDTGRAPEALALARATLTRDRGYLPGHALLAGLLERTGDAQGASDVLALWAERALDARDDAQLAQALAALDAVRTPPRDPLLLANLLRVAGREADARRIVARRLADRPADLGAKLTAAMTRLAIVHASDAEIDERRRRYAEELAGVGEQVATAAPDALRDALPMVGKAKPFFLAYQGRDDRALQATYGRAIARIRSVADVPALPARREARARIRVGVASRYLHLHSVSKLYAGWIERLDRRRFEVVVYHLGRTRDAMCERFARAAARFESGERPVNAWAARIAADAPDVLLYPELGMDEIAIQLACHRLAPVQCVTWGHPVTTGLPHMDYFLSSALMEPPEGDAHYTEALVRLPNLSIAYEPLPVRTGLLTRAQLGLRDSATVYVCCQSLFKYLPGDDRVLTELARRVPDAQFLFIGDATQPPARVFAERLRRAFAGQRLSFERHVAIRPPVPFEQFASFVGLGDVYLDSIGWSGGNTTLEALACDLPVVTMPTALMRGRHSAAILAQMDVRETIAPSLDGYVAIAASLAERERRAEMRARIAGARARLYGDTTPVRALECFFEQALARALDGAREPALHEAAA